MNSIAHGNFICTRRDRFIWIKQNGETSSFFLPETIILFCSNKLFVESNAAFLHQTNSYLMETNVLFHRIQQKIYLIRIFRSLRALKRRRNWLSRRACASPKVKNSAPFSRWSYFFIKLLCKWLYNNAELLLFDFDLIMRVVLRYPVFWNGWFYMAVWPENVNFYVLRGSTF